MLNVQTYTGELPARSRKGPGESETTKQLRELFGKSAVKGEPQIIMGIDQQKEREKLIIRMRAQASKERYSLAIHLVGSDIVFTTDYLKGHPQWVDPDAPVVEEEAAPVAPVKRSTRKTTSKT